MKPNKITIIEIIIGLFISFQLSNAQWQPDVRLTNNSAESHTSPSNAWCVAACGDTVHVVWFDARDGLDEIYYKRSPDRGVTWTSDTRLTYSGSYAQYPSVFVSGSIVHIVWQDMRNGWEIYYKRSTDAGTTWGADVRLTYDPGNSWNPTVITAGSTVHVFWHDTRTGPTQIFYKRSTDGGTSWGSDIRLDTTTGQSWFPSCAVSGSILHAAWCDDSPGNFEIYYKRSTDLGLTWSSRMRLTNDPGTSTNPIIAISGLNAHMVWCDTRDGNVEVYYKRSTDLGISWGADTRLTFDTSESAYVSVAAFQSNVHVLWHDRRDGNYEIYYKLSTNNGLNWSADTRLTNAAGSSIMPSMALSGGYVHVVWMDNRDGNYEIYYKRNIPLEIPNAPTLISPPNGSQYQPTTIRFTWSKPQSAASYRLQIANDSSFSSLVINDSTLTDSTIIVTGLLSSHNYWWRVNAKNSVGTSQWSTVFHFNTNLAGIKTLSNEIPKEYKLYVNYPNPFNPTTKIKFDIPNIPLSRGVPEGRGVLTTLKIHDILGHEIATLVNEGLQLGTYEVEWDGTNYPSGIYFYKLVVSVAEPLQTGSFTQTRRMILIK